VQTSSNSMGELGMVNKRRRSTKPSASHNKAPSSAKCRRRASEHLKRSPGLKNGQKKAPTQLVLFASWGGVSTLALPGSYGLLGIARGLVGCPSLFEVWSLSRHSRTVAPLCWINIRTYPCVFPLSFAHPRQSTGRLSQQSSAWVNWCCRW
jgi:hypothetical protein